MSFTDAISGLTQEQLKEVIKSRRAVPIATFSAANGKARQACALRHKGWMDYANLFVNAMLVACKKTGTTDALTISTLMSAVESFAIGMIAKEDLTLEEHVMLIGPIAEIATPEVIPKVQNWEPAPLPKNEDIARQNYQLLKERDQKRGRSSGGDDPDPDGDLVDTGIDPEAALRALLKPKAPKPQETTPSKISSADAISKMMQALKKKPVEEEKVRVEPASGGGFQLVGVNTGTIYGDLFTRPADAIVYATKSKLKLGTKE